MNNEGYSSYSDATTEVPQNYKGQTLSRCLCGCGYTFLRKGRRIYYDAAHKQRDYRNRRSARVWAWRYVMDECSGDLTQYPEVYHRYLLYFRTGK